MPFSLPGAAPSGGGGGGLTEPQVKAEIKPYARADNPRTLIEGDDLAEDQRLPAPDGDKWLKWDSAGEALENTDPPSGGGSDELSVRAALPPVAGFSLGDVVNVGGVLWRLAAGTEDPHVYHGTVEDLAGNLVGDATFSAETRPSNVRFNPLAGDIGLNAPTSPLYIEVHSGADYAETSVTLVAGQPASRTAAQRWSYLRTAGEPGIYVDNWRVGAGFTVAAYDDEAKTRPVRIVANANRWVLAVSPRETGGGESADPAAAWRVEGQIESGALRHLVVVAPGAGYTSDPVVAIDAPPAGGVQATATVTRSSGTIASLTITNAGAGYVDRPNVRLVGGGGAGAVVKAVIGAAVTSAAPAAQGAWGAWTTLVTLPALTAAQTGRALVTAQTHHESGLGGGGGDRLILERRVVRRRGAVDTVLSGQVDYGPRQLNPGGLTSRAFAVASSVSDEEMVAVDDVQAGDVLRLDSRVVLQRTAGAAVVLAAPPLVNNLSVTALAGGAAAGGGGQGQQSPGDAADGFSRGAAEPAGPVHGDVWSNTGAGDALQRRTSGGAWDRIATEGFVQSQDALTLLAIDNTVRSLFRRAQWARAWIRAANAAAALAGVSAATWTNQGSGTPPTGAYWDAGSVPSSVTPLWELTALVSPTPGDPDGWTFGAWTALHVTGINTQYSVDGSAWHADPRTGADRYERHFVNGAWGPAIALFDEGALDWTLLLQADIFHAATNLPNLLLSLPSPIVFANFSDMRIRLGTYTSGAPVVKSSLVVDPEIFISEPWSERAQANPQSHTVWAATLDIKGLKVSAGMRGLGASGPSGDGTNAGLELVWIRPNRASHAGEAGYLRAFYMLNRNVTHRLRIEAR